MGVGTLAGDIGRGLVAGLAGTAAITASQLLQQQLQDGEESQMAAAAVEEVLELEPKHEQAEERLNNLTHWAYGTGWGVFRGLLGAAGLHGPAATALHFAAVTGAAMTMLPGLGLSPKPTEWSPQQLATDSWHHLVYAVAAGLVYDRLDRR